MIRTPFLLHAGIVLFFLVWFILLSKLEDREWVRNLDFAVTVKVQEKIDNSKRLRTVKVIDTVLGGAAYFASPGFTVLATLVFTGLAWRKSKKALLLPLFLLLLVLVEIYAKSVVHHPSPPFGMIKHTTGLFPDNYINTQFSYPSGHAARAMFLSILAYVTAGKHILVVLGLGVYVFLVSLSKIYLGHHWFSDVVGGLFLGAAFGIPIVWLLDWENISKKSGQIPLQAL